MQESGSIRKAMSAWNVPENHQRADAANNFLILDLLPEQTVNQKAYQREKGYKPYIVKHSRLLLCIDNS